MSSDFTVVFSGRHHMGDTEGRFNREAPDCKFMGQHGVFSFDTPGVNADAEAVLTFQSFGIDLRTNTLSINGTDIPFALSPSVEREWKAHSVVVPAGVLKDSGNEIRLDALTRSGSPDGNVDDFLVDNMSIHYKTG